MPYKAVKALLLDRIETPVETVSPGLEPAVPTHGRPRANCQEPIRFLELISRWSMACSRCKMKVGPSDCTAGLLASAPFRTGIQAVKLRQETRQGRIGHRLDPPHGWFRGTGFSRPRWPACCVGDGDDRVSGVLPFLEAGIPTGRVFQQPVWGLIGCLGSTSPRHAGPCRTLRANARRRGAGREPSEGFGGSAAPCAATRIPS